MKIVPVFMRYDYGIKSRGDSGEYRVIYPVLKQITNEVYPFWYDRYLTKKDELQKRVIQFIDEINPDIIFFILMRDELSFKTLDYLKDKYITINWFCDDQWRFENFTQYYAPHFTYSVTTDKFALKKYRNIGYKNVILSQWASFGFSNNINFKTIKYKYDVSFVGSISGYREYLINQLKKKDIKVECYGYGWKNGRVTFEEMGEIFKNSKINLNISNSVNYDVRYIFSSLRSIKEFLRSKKRIEQIKARNFEIPAFGGFQLTNYVTFLEDYFKIGREIAVYSSFEDLLLQIRYYLENELERRKIMINGYKRVINEHTYLNRLKNVIKIVTSNK
ncbi:glycosyltransferase [bacterium]|nr:glycosyltransferase [bacterium]MBU4510902.1 glycosyltransferase [bacterium]